MDLERFNPTDNNKITMINTPSNPSSTKENPQNLNSSAWNTPKPKFRDVSPIHFQNQFDMTPTPTKNYPIQISHISPPPGFEIFFNHMGEHTYPSSSQFTQNNNFQHGYTNTCPDVFYMNFMQKFTFSPTLTLNEQEGILLMNNAAEKSGMINQNFEDYLIPLDHIKQSLLNKTPEEIAFPLTSSGLANVLRKCKEKEVGGTMKEDKKGKEIVQDSDSKKPTSRKRPTPGDKAKFEPVKKRKISKKSPVKSASSANTAPAVTGDDQHRPAP